MSDLEHNEFWQTQTRGTNQDEYALYLEFANDGNGGDLTNNGEPLATYDEWMGS